MTAATFRTIAIAGGVVLATALLAVLASSKVYARSARFAPSFAPVVVALARKWSAARGLPVSWVLATIWIESRGDAGVHRISSREDSYGLMQVNVRAHAERLARAGVAPTDLFDPETNIKWGSLILREAYERALKSGLRPIDLATRLVYNVGHVPASPPAEKVVAWSEALARTEALV